MFSEQDEFDLEKQLLIFENEKKHSKTSVIENNDEQVTKPEKNNTKELNDKKEINNKSKKDKKNNNPFKSYYLSFYSENDLKSNYDQKTKQLLEKYFFFFFNIQ